MVSRPLSSRLRTIQAFWSLKRSTTLPSSYWYGKPALNLLGGSDSTLGKRKRTVPRTMPSIDRVRVVKPIASQLPNRARRKKRRSLPLAGALAAGLGAAAAAGLGAAVAGWSGGFGVASDMTALWLGLKERARPGAAAGPCLGGPCAIRVTKARAGRGPIPGTVVVSVREMSTFFSRRFRQP